MDRVILIATLACLFTTRLQAAPRFEWQRDQKSLALMHAGNTVWQFNCRKEAHKPFFHPLSTIDGHSLTQDQPPDHVWHHGLWYSFKFLNGVNFWEENPKTGLSDGSTRVMESNSITRDDFSAQFQLRIEYEIPKTRAKSKQLLLREDRNMEVSAPDESGNYTLDFEHRFTALEDVSMGRTPLKSEPNGKAYGGYAGFSLRHHKDLSTDNWQFVAPNSAKPTHGSHYPWLAFVGRWDQRSAATAIFDHPSNPRHPAPWYISKALPFYSPSFLFHSKWDLKKGDSFTQKYRVKVFSTAPTNEMLERDWSKYARNAKE